MSNVVSQMWSERFCLFQANNNVLLFFDGLFYLLHLFDEFLQLSLFILQLGIQPGMLGLKLQAGQSGDLISQIQFTLYFMLYYTNEPSTLVTLIIWAGCVYTGLTASSQAPAAVADNPARTHGCQPHRSLRRNPQTPRPPSKMTKINPQES